MTAVLLPIVLGALVGWIGSLLMRTETQEGILIDILLGVVGGLTAPRLLGSGTALDNVLAAYLGAVVLVGILAITRRTITSPST